MKKFVAIAFLFLFAANVCYADKNWFDIEVAKIRDVKNAQNSVINDELKKIDNSLLQIQADTRLSESQKAKLSHDYNARKSELTAEKARIEEQYKMDKAELKRRWKNGETGSTSYSKSTYTVPVRTQTTTTTKTYSTKYETPSKVEAAAYSKPVKTQTTTTTTTYSKPQYQKTTQTYTVEKEGKIKSSDLRTDLQQTNVTPNFQVKLNKHHK